MTTLTELLLRDPEHPEVRRLLMDRYEQVCKERALLMKVLNLSTPRSERDTLAYQQRTRKIDA